MKCTYKLNLFLFSVFLAKHYLFVFNFWLWCHSGKARSKKWVRHCALKILKYTVILICPGSEFQVHKPVIENMLPSVFMSFTLEVDNSLVPVECGCHTAFKSHRDEVVTHVTWVNSTEGSEEED